MTRSVQNEEKESSPSVIMVIVLVIFLILTAVLFASLHGIKLGHDGFEELTAIGTVSLATVAALPLIAMSALLYGVARNTDRSVAEQVKLVSQQKEDGQVDHERASVMAIEDQIVRFKTALFNLGANLTSLQRDLQVAVMIVKARKSQDLTLEVAVNETAPKMIEWLGRIAKTLEEMGEIPLAHKVFANLKNGTASPAFSASNAGALSNFHQVRLAVVKLQISLRLLMPSIENIPIEIKKELLDMLLSSPLLFMVHVFSKNSPNSAFRNCGGEALVSLIEGFPSMNDIKPVVDGEYANWQQVGRVTRSRTSDVGSAIDSAKLAGGGMHKYFAHHFAADRFKSKELADKNIWFSPEVLEELAPLLGKSR